MKIRVLFVDDESKILSGIKRSLRHKRSDWEMEFYTSAVDALTAINDNPCDVVVTDIRMPGMDGVELIERISQQYPTTIRIMLSGQSDNDKFIKSGHLAHYFLNKPTDAETISEVIERMLKVRDKVSNSRMSLLMSLRSIPSLPTLYSQLVMEINSEHSTSNTIAAIIEKDIGMTAKILKLVNSSFYGMRNKVHSVAFAISLLGSNTLKSFVLFYRLNNAYESLKMKHLDVNQLWKISEQISVLAGEIAKNERANKKTIDDVMVAGLLQSLGILVLANHAPRSYEKILQDISDNDGNLIEAERRVLGMSHLEAASYVLEIWGLPESVYRSVEFCSSPTLADEGEKGIVPYLYAAIYLISQNVNSILFNNLQLEDSYLEKLGLLEKLPVWDELCKEIVNRG
ncbi:MAG: response regulator [FCB group bacterium]|nr:response regulator [FCB group bacterium]